MKQAFAFLASFLVCMIFLAKEGISQDSIPLLSTSDEEFKIDPDAAIKINAVKSKDCLVCNVLNGRSKGCKLIESVRYDSNGRIMKFIIGTDINKNQIDRIADFKYADNGETLIISAKHPKQGQLWKFKYLYTIDNQGMMISRFDTASEKSVQAIFTYKNLDRDTAELTITLSGSRPFVDRKYYIRTANKRGSSSIEFSNATSSNRTYLTQDNTLIEENYNKHGRLIDRTLSYVSSNEKAQFKKTVYFYNSGGNLTCELIVDNEQKVSNRKCYDYFQEGSFARYTEDSPGMFLEIEYDALGNIIKTRIVDKFTNNIRVNENEFKNGLIAKELIYLNNELTQIKRYRYK